MADEEKAKVCPMMSAGRDFTDRCLKEECVWWIADDKECAILNLAKRLLAIYRISA